jgi:hypothetical protein
MYPNNFNCTDICAGVDGTIYAISSSTKGKVYKFNVVT